MVLNFNVQNFITSEAVSIFNAGVTTWQAAIGIAFMTSIAMLVFIYLIGTLLRNQSLVNFVKFEIYELIVTAILIGVLVSLVDFMSDLRVSFFFPHMDITLPNGTLYRDLGMYEATQKYYELVQDKFMGWLYTNFLFSMWMDNLASVTPYARPLGVGIVAAPLAGFAAPLKQMLYNVTTALSIGFVISAAQLIVFQFAVVGFLKYYIPIGIFLRTFTPTRRIGGGLIAVGLGFLFILPIMTILSAEMVLGSNGATAGADTAIRTVFPTLIGSTLGDYSAIQNSFGYGQNARSFADYIWTFTFGAFGAIGKVLQFTVGNILFIILLIPLHVVGIGFAIGYLLPALTVIVLVQAVKQMSTSLGQEVDISSLTRLI